MHMPRKVFVIAGHEGKGTGATSSLMDEGTETLVLRDYVIQFLRNDYKITAISDDPRSNLYNIIAWLKNKINKNDIILDIHFNAFNDPKANGTEVLIPTLCSEEEKLAGTDLLHVSVQALGTYNRGIHGETRSPHKRLGMLSGPVEALNLLLEVCFCTNMKDTSLYYKNRVALAKSIASVLAKYANK